MACPKLLDMPVDSGMELVSGYGTVINADLSFEGVLQRAMAQRREIDGLAAIWLAFVWRSIRALPSRTTDGRV